jgi:hypothetical protein
VGFWADILNERKRIKKMNRNSLHLNTEYMDLELDIICA